MDIYIYTYDKIAKNYTDGEIKDLCRYIPDLSYSCLDKKNFFNVISCEFTLVIIQM